MNPKLKPALLILGLLASVLIISQLAMGLLIVQGAGSPNILKLIKAHQHSGYLTVTVVLIYIVLSLWAIVSTPSRPKA
jgi:cytochrome b561